MRSGILRIHVKMLRLRVDAPFPSQLRDWQRYRMWARPAGPDRPELPRKPAPSDGQSI